ncbi:MAG: hypothetical protein PS018_11805 [bacterium]|nr:hypothetical protein [bacterium]
MAKTQPLDGVIGTAKKALANKDHLELGRLIARELDQREATTADFIVLSKRIGCSLRTSRYAADVYRLAQNVGLSAKEVADIGWTKLAVMTAASGDAPAKADLVAFCAGRTVTELRAALAGKAGAVKTVAFTLNKRQRAELDAALVRFGARRHGRSILGKELALMKLVSKAI